MTPSYRRIPRVTLDGRRYPILIDPSAWKDSRSLADGTAGGPADEAADTMQKAYEAGYEAGYSTARNEMEKQVAANAAALASMADDLAAQRSRMIGESEEALLRLACQIARRVVEEIAETDEAAIARVVRASLSRLGESQKVTLRVNPADLDSLKRHEAEWLHATRSGSAIEIKEDERIRRGGCLVEGTSGNIEGEIDRQIEVIERALVEAIG